jgi:hypothetical protein
LDWEGWGQAPDGFDGATLYAFSLLQADTAARVRDAFPALGSPADLAAEATVCTLAVRTHLSGVAGHRDATIAGTIGGLGALALSATALIAGIA